MKKSFLLYHNQKDMFNILTDEQSGKLIKEIFKYAETFNVPKIKDQVVNMAFISIKGNLDRDNDKYQKICERNKINGLKGGRPNNPENPVGYLGTQEKPNNPKNPSQPDNDNDNGNGSDNDLKEKPTASAAPKKFKPLKKTSEIEKLCMEIYNKKIFPKVHQWKNKMLKDGQNEKAIFHTLKRCLKKEKLKDCWSYCNRIIQVENGNYNEKESISKHEGFKSEKVPERFKSLAENMTKEI